MTSNKKMLSVEEIGAQAALELPDREMLATISASGIYDGQVYSYTYSSPKLSLAQANNLCAQFLALAPSLGITNATCIATK